MSNLKITNDTLFNFLEFLSMQDVYFETIEEKTEAIDKFLLSDFYRPLKINNPKVKTTDQLSIDEFYDWCTLRKEHEKYYIIQGNVFENPELLKAFVLKIYRK